MTNKVPEIRVGIITATKVRFSINGIYTVDGKHSFNSQACKAYMKEGLAVIETENATYSAGEFILKPKNSSKDHFSLHDVIIGIGFHWQKKEDQDFRGILQLMGNEEKITVVNIIPVEEYLMSVISSEMRATSSMELLKAHAVISRGWVLSQLENRKDKHQQNSRRQMHANEREMLRWYDHEDHDLFDVCADDHCQRYQGITKESTTAVREAVLQTTGEVLTWQGTLCDTRFSKCCGGVTELFENTWEPVHHPYLVSVRDADRAYTGEDADLRVEENAAEWISGRPHAFCNTNNSIVLREVLNDYDQSTNDFYRWKVSHTVHEISELIKKKTGVDFGLITDLIPVQRGVSGRIIQLKVVGKKRTMIIGKELEIRKALSESHLYSSAFVVEKDGRGKSARFTFHGAGWGHGVGLCQIGAAVMGAKGYSYRQILEHYYPGAEVEKKY